MTKSAQDFARDLTAIVDASANALTTLSRVLQQQQQSILALASEGGVSASSSAGGTSASRSPETQATVTAPLASIAPAVDASPGPASQAASSPEALLAEAEKTARALLQQAPEISLAHLYQAAAHAVSLALMNTASAQQQLNIVAQAVVTRAAANQLSSARSPAAPAPEKVAAPEPAGALRGQVPKARAR